MPRTHLCYYYYLAHPGVFPGRCVDVMTFTFALLLSPRLAALLTRDLSFAFDLDQALDRVVSPEPPTCALFNGSLLWTTVLHRALVRSKIPVAKQTGVWLRDFHRSLPDI